MCQCTNSLQIETWIVGYSITDSIGSKDESVTSKQSSIRDREWWGRDRNVCVASVSCITSWKVVGACILKLFHLDFHNLYFSIVSIIITMDIHILNNSTVRSPHTRFVSI